MNPWVAVAKQRSPVAPCPEIKLSLIIRDHVIRVSAFRVTFRAQPPHIPPNMKTASPLRSSHRRGLTLLELTVVITFMIAMTTILVIGAHSWRRSTERTNCIITIRNVQMAVRSFQNMHGYDCGAKFAGSGGESSITENLRLLGFINDDIHYDITEGRCPGGGVYDIKDETTFPLLGELYIHCNLEDLRKHTLPGGNDW